MKSIIALFFLMISQAFSQSIWVPVRSVNDYGLRDLIMLRDSSVYISSFTSLYRADLDFSFWREIKGYPDAIASITPDNLSPHGIVLAGGAMTLFHSVDGGRTWGAIGGIGGNHAKRVYAGKPGTYFVTCDPDNLVRMEIGGPVKRVIDGVDWQDRSFRGITSFGDNRTIAYTSPASIYYSATNGDSWSLAYSGLEDMSVQHIYTDSKTALASTLYHGIMRSSPPITTWVPSREGLGASGDPSMSVKRIVTDQRGGLVAITAAGLYRSSDDGVRWEHFGGSLPEWFKVSELLVDSQENFIALYGDDSVMVSRDSARSWSLVSAGLSVGAVHDVLIDDDTIFAAGNSCLFQARKASYAPLYWHQSIDSLQYPRIRKMLKLPDRALLAFDEHGGVSIRERRSGTWQTFGAGIQQGLVSCVATSKAGAVFAGTEAGGLFRSMDRGMHWTELQPATTGSAIASVYCLSDSTLLLGSLGSGLFRSTDGGDSWSPITSGIAHTYITSFTQTPGGDIYAGTFGEGVFRSTDAGLTWQSAAGNIGNTYVTTLLTTNIGIVAAGTFGGGIFYTRNKGENWIAIGKGLVDLRVLSLYMDFDRRLFALTADGVLWTAEGLLPTAIPPMSKTDDFTLLSLYPNPFSKETTVTFELSRATDITVELIDMLGRLVTQARAGWCDAGLHHVAISAGAVPAGVYVVRVNTGHTTRKIMALHVR